MEQEGVCAGSRKPKFWAPTGACLLDARCAIASPPLLAPTRSQQGNTGHYKFERCVEPLGGMKQMLMLASTPSDRRYIWTLRAAIARADREVEEKLQERAQTGLA